jgi:hypothetical protein
MVNEEGTASIRIEEETFPVEDLGLRGRALTFTGAARYRGEAVQYRFEGTVRGDYLEGVFRTAIGDARAAGKRDQSAPSGETRGAALPATTPEDGSRSGPGSATAQRPTETVMLPGGVPLEMVYIPAGTFLMGAYAGEQGAAHDEFAQHEVRWHRASGLASMR